MSWMRLAVAGLALCASAAGAQGTPATAPQGAPQGPPAPGGQAGRGMQMLFEGITLTEAQQTQVQEISAKYREQMRAIREGLQGAPPTEETRAKIEEIRSKQNAEIRALLAAEQHVIVPNDLAAAKERGKQGAQKPPAGH